jgi:hypothetical protein
MKNNANSIEGEDELSACVGGMEARDQCANDTFVYLVALKLRNVFQVRLRTQRKNIDEENGENILADIHTSTTN